MSVSFVLPHGYATVMDLEPASVEGATERYGYSRSQQWARDVIEARRTTIEKYRAIVAGKAPRRRSPGRYAHGVTLPYSPVSRASRYSSRPLVHGGALGARELAAYIENTGRAPRTIADYLGGLGVTDSGRLHRAMAEWSPRATVAALDRG